MHRTACIMRDCPPAFFFSLPLSLSLSFFFFLLVIHVCLSVSSVFKLCFVVVVVCVQFL